MDTNNITNPEIELDEFLDKISKFLDKKLIEDLAKETKFVKRERKLTGAIFLTLYVFGVSKYGTPTIENLLSLLHTYDKEFRLSRSSLQERINKEAVEFFTYMLSISLLSTIPEQLKVKIPGQFKSILIWDSTKFQLPETLEKLFPGQGGSGKSAGIKIQFGFDLQTCLWFYSLEAGSNSDSESGLETLKFVESENLIIQDLGYFNVEILNKIQQKKAYYLSRMKLDAKAYVKEGKKFISMDLIDLTSQNFDQRLEIDVFIRSKKNTYIKTRLVIEKLPEQVTNQRLRKMNKEATSRGKQVSHRRKTLAMYNFYITNASPDQLPSFYMRFLYSCRWQVELIFKTWKSHLDLAHIRSCRLESVLLLILAKLINITIFSKIIRACSGFLWITKSREISYFRAFQHLLSISEQLFFTLFRSTNQFFCELKSATDFICENCYKIPQKDRIYPLARLQMLEKHWLTS